MKKLNPLLLILMVITSSITGAFAQPVRDSSQKIFINAKGGMHNHAGTTLGYVDKNDVVRDNTGKELYFIDKSGNVIGSDGRKLGRAKRMDRTITSKARMF